MVKIDRFVYTVRFCCVVSCLGSRQVGGTLKIPFSEISSTGKGYTLSDLSVPSGQEVFELQEPFEFSCTLQKNGENRVVLQGRVQASLMLSCNRCLASYPFRVQTNMQLIFELQTREHLMLKDVDLTVVDLDVIELSEPVIDLEELARQQLYMALPVQQICTENCKGICPECGNDLNEMTCSCKGQKKNNPFAVLAALKKK